jgi:hypothetical protein
MSIRQANIEGDEWASPAPVADAKRPTMPPRHNIDGSLIKL